MVQDIQLVRRDTRKHPVAIAAVKPAYGMQAAMVFSGFAAVLYSLILGGLI